MLPLIFANISEISYICIAIYSSTLIQTKNFPYQYIMDDLSELFRSVVDQAGALDIAASEFQKMLADDPELRAEYKEWCEENGYSERRGFNEFAEDYVNSREEKWDSLTDYDQ